MGILSDKKMFLKYEEVRKSGKYDMIKESVKAMDEAGLRPCDYFYVVQNYNMLFKKYGGKNDNTTKPNER